jgi:hypothetical protein
VGAARAWPRLPAPNDKQKKAAAVSVNNSSSPAAATLAALRRRTGSMVLPGGFLIMVKYRRGRAPLPGWHLSCCILLSLKKKWRGRASAGVALADRILELDEMRIYG